MTTMMLLKIMFMIYMIIDLYINVLSDNPNISPAIKLFTVAKFIMFITIVANRAFF